MPARDRVPRTGIKRERTVLLYDYDLNAPSIFIRIDLLLGDNPTPVTPSYERRITRGGLSTKVIPKRNFEPRRAITCFSGGINRTVYIPYKPNTADHRQHLRELTSLKLSRIIETIGYEGESR